MPEKLYSVSKEEWKRQHNQCLFLDKRRINDEKLCIARAKCECVEKIKEIRGNIARMRANLKKERTQKYEDYVAGTKREAEESNGRYVFAGIVKESE